MSSETPANKLYSIEDILNLPDPEWLIQNFLPKASFAVLFGPPSVGKSFLALSLALAIAAGKHWLGKDVKGGPVIYIAAEGFGGLKLRISALLLHSDYDVDTECAFLNRPINFLKVDAVQALIKPIKESGVQPALIIIDTLARCFVGGDENSAQEMGLFIDGAETVKRETGATVLAIHHTGKNEQRGARGSNALIGAADTIIGCSGEINCLGIKCEKMKDAEPFKKFSLSAQTVELENGRKSCVLVPFDEAMSAMVSPAKQENIRKMIAVLEKKFDTEGATHGKWMRACMDAGMSDSNFARGLRDMKEGLVAKEGDGQGARYRVDKSEAVSVSPGVKPMS
jgi:hypothetical protein